MRGLMTPASLLLILTLAALPSFEQCRKAPGQQKQEER
jgi:hypothetical protein